MTKKNKPTDIGKIRNSQIITTWGPGSLVQLENDSVLVTGLDAWPEAFSNEDSLSKYKVLHHPYLERICKKEYFRMPQSDDDTRAGIPVVSFPTWGYCSNKWCGRLQQHKQFTSDYNGQFFCEECKGELIPSRFVLLCEHGHLDDFPWIEWAHSACREGQENSQEASICDDPKLIWRSNSMTTSLASYYVECKTCHKKRSMYGAYGNNLANLPDLETNKPIPFVCKGARPWLGKSQPCPPQNVSKEKKDQPTQIRAELTRSSSLYFSSMITALQIPQFRHKLHIAIQNNFQTVQNDLEDEKTLEQIAQRKSIFKELLDEYTTEEIIEKLNERLNPEIETELDIREKEYHDIINTDFEGDEIIQINNVPLNENQKTYLDSLKMVDRLTVIKALRGFTRKHPPDPFAIGETNFAKIHISEKINWLPGVESKGEGIFLTLNEEKISAWAQKDAVKERCDAIISSFNEWADLQNIKQRDISPKYILLHTLSHVLIRELAFSSGYNEASISERIYSGDEYNGILLYTASSSSDGSLGGLVRQGAVSNFIPLLNNALKKSLSCSRDPLCKQIDPTDPIEKEKPAYNRLNGSACYGCSLVPETSCEEFNRLLDRRLLFDPELGFFGEYIE